MKFRWLQTILAVLVGTGWVAAQPQNPTGSVPTPTQPAVVAPIPATDLTAPPAGGGMEFADDGHPLYSVYGFGEALFWNFRDANLPILVNSVPVGFVPVVATQTVNGVATPATTPVPISIRSAPQIPGASDIDTSNHLGVRAGGGIWFGDGNEWGGELSGFGVQERTQAFRLNNSNNPQNLSLNTGLNNVVITTTGGGGAGGAPPAVITQTTPLIFPRVAVANTSGTFSTYMWGAEANVLRKGCYYGPLLLSGLTGVRYHNFEEEANVTNSVTLTLPSGVADPVVGAFPNPLQYTTFDQIRAKNQFYGVQVGAEADLVYGGFFFNARGKVALGDVRQEIKVLGTTSFTGTVVPIANMGGLLSSPGDQGTFSRDRVAFLPEVNVKIGYRIGDWLRIHVGYDALYMQHVVRPGGQTQIATLNSQLGIAGTNTVVNVGQPVIQMRDMDVWVQGMNAGLELRY